MNLFLSTISTSSSAGLYIAGLFGAIFGVLLHKGQVTNYNVIVNFFRLKDPRVLKVMLTAVVVGGIGVFVLISGGAAEGWHIKPALVLGIVLGASIFGVGMTLYGYCPGTAIAAIATGSVHALVGLFGMLVGGVVYALSYPWLKTHVLNVGDLGKARLTDYLPISEGATYAVIGVGALLLFRFLDRNNGPKSGKPAKASRKLASASSCCGGSGGG